MWSKQTLRTSTCHQHAFLLVTAGSPIFYKPPTHSLGIKTDSPNSHRSPTRFAWVKTGSAKLYKARTRFAAVKADSPNFQKPPTRFLVVKTEFPNSYTLGGGQNGMSKPLQVSNTLYSSQKIPSVLCVNQNRPSRTLYKPPIRSVVVKTYSQNSYKPPTRFQLVQIGSPNFDKPATHSP